MSASTSFLRVLRLNLTFVSAAAPIHLPPCFSEEPWATDLHNPERSVRVCVFKCIVMGIELVSRFPNLIIPTGLGRSAHSMSKRRNLVTDENGADKNPAGLQRERERQRRRNGKRQTALFKSGSWISITPFFGRGREKNNVQNGLTQPIINPQLWTAIQFRGIQSVASFCGLH